MSQFLPYNYTHTHTNTDNHYRLESLLIISDLFRNPRRIVLGTHDLSKPADTVKDVIMKCIHPHYIGVGNGNDIMLLKVSRFFFSLNIQKTYL